VAITRGENATSEAQSQRASEFGRPDGVPSPIVVGKDIDILPTSSGCKDVAGQSSYDVTGVGRSVLFADAPESTLRWPRETQGRALHVARAGDDKRPAGPGEVLRTQQRPLSWRRRQEGKLDEKPGRHGA